MEERAVLAEFANANCVTDGCTRIPCVKTRTPTGEVFHCRICLDRSTDSVTDLRTEARQEIKQKGDSMMKITGGELAPAVLIEIMRHYIDKLSLEIEEILFIDNYDDERVNAFEPDQKIICMNFGRIPAQVADHGWANAMLHTALWAVQVCAALEVIRIAVQEQYYGFEKMEEEELDRDIELFVGQELRQIAARGQRLFIPEFLEEMGCIGLRLRDALNEQYQQGGARKDLAAWNVGGDVDTDEFRKFMKPEAVDNLQKSIREGEMGRHVEGFYFLTIDEYLALVCEEECLIENIDVMAKYSEAVIDEGSLTPAEGLPNLEFVEPEETEVDGTASENSETTE